MTSTNFWTDGKIEPKRQNRWYVQFDGIHNGVLFTATKVGRPEIEITNKEHKYLNHTFNYPGRATWKPITLTIVDVADDGTGETSLNATAAITNIIEKSGYKGPPGNSAYVKTISKSAAIDALSTGTRDDDSGGGDANGVNIKMVNADGTVVETWNLKNAFITNFKPSELSYEGEELATVDITITYDYCEYGAGDNANRFTSQQNAEGEGGGGGAETTF